MKKIDLYINGKIFTVNGKDWHKNPAAAMAVSEGVVLAIGEEAHVKSCIDSISGKKNISEIDLGGRTVLPGLVDTHVHMPGSALTELFQIYLYHTRTKADTLAAITEFVRTNPEREMYFGTGFYLSISSHTDGPPKEWLDGIEGEKPVVLESSDGHSLWLNTAAFEHFGIDANTKLPLGGRLPLNEAGEPRGILTDAHQLITTGASYSEAEVIRALKYYQQEMLTWGYTSAMHIAPHFCDPQIFLKLHATPDWHIRVNMSVLSEPETPVLNSIKEAEELSKSVKTSTVKFFVDGVIEGKSAYLKEPYIGTDGHRSELMWDADELVLAFIQVMRAGYQIHVHAIGDAGVRASLDALKIAREKLEKTGNYYQNGRFRGRDVITHLHLVDYSDIPLAKDLGIIGSFQPFWHFKEPEWYEKIDLAFLGEKRAMEAYPVASFIREGIAITFSGDYPASPINNAFWAIEAAVTRNLPNEEHYNVEKIKSIDDETWLRNPSERIGLKEAIEAYTINGARQLFREADIGSLVPGKLADFIILNEDIFSISVLDIDQIETIATYIGGERVR